MCAVPVGGWPNAYSQTTYNMEKVIRFFYLATNEYNWQPSVLEKQGYGENPTCHAC